MADVRYQILVPEAYGEWPLHDLLDHKWDPPADGGVMVQVIGLFGSTGHREATRRRVLLFEVTPAELDGLDRFASFTRLTPTGQRAYRLIGL